MPGTIPTATLARVAATVCERVPMAGEKGIIQLIKELDPYYPGLLDIFMADLQQDADPHTAEYAP